MKAEPTSTTTPPTVPTTNSKTAATTTSTPAPTMTSTTPLIAIVGRPNVGKSTLFNRIIGKRKAIIAEEAGTTRDRITQKIEINGFEVLLVDTGGLEYGKNENIEENIQIQSKIAIQDANVILFIIDGTAELTANDYAAVEILRKSSKSIILVLNKCDTSDKINESTFNIYELGFGEPVKISAIHKLGIDNLKNQIEASLIKQKFSKTRKKSVKKNIEISFLGKPNAGKSSLVNALVGSEKIIVSEIPGTTRDSIDLDLEFEGKKFTFIDTAGLRRPGKRERGIEKFSVLRALNAIERSEIVTLLIDGEKGISHQDLHIANHALSANKGLILAINKIDILDIQENYQHIFLARMKRKFAFIPWAPIIFVSAKNKTNIFEILKIAENIVKERAKRIPTAEINGFFQKITRKHLPASSKTTKPRFFYGSQVDINPPKFILFFSNPGNLHFTYPRFLENEIRKEFGFWGTAIQIIIKNKAGVKELS